MSKSIGVLADVTFDEIVNSIKYVHDAEDLIFRLLESIETNNRSHKDEKIAIFKNISEWVSDALVSVEKGK